MGFSTSGAVVVILIGFLIAMGAFVPALFDAGAATGEAFSSQQQSMQDQANTDINLEFTVTYNATSEEIVDSPIATVSNDGTTTLDLERTDRLENGEYVTLDRTDDDVAIVEGDSERTDSTLWSPGTVLEFEYEPDELETDLEKFDDEDDVWEYDEQERLTLDGSDDDRIEDRLKIVTEHGIADASTLEVTLERYVEDDEEEDK
ncbi:flagellin [Natrarchaeobaculum sulfurireducens]|uniref:Flagellin n=1 Tax=Natrarchaeobaculum sulfurireducens TaxID=2044521 RepID=A0A346PNU2_9EURY|nr:flagellin [Natrarchaeobaculum sulfurireducens]AXR81187.1 hypothetical protein AArcMg_1171 [Natrarchaeobaculum sulfurireducens]